MFVLYPVIRLTPSFEERVQRFHKCEAQLASLKADYSKKKDMLTTEQSQELLSIINDCEVKLEQIRADISKYTIRYGLTAIAAITICIIFLITKII